jgi:hypothetical protein
VQPIARAGLQTDAVADHHTSGVALGLSGEHRPHLPAAGSHSIGRAVPLEHGPQERRYHSDGARAIASSSAAFTSYRESSLRRSSASASVRPQASGSVST